MNDAEMAPQSIRIARNGLSDSPAPDHWEGESIRLIPDNRGQLNNDQTWDIALKLFHKFLIAALSERGYQWRRALHSRRGGGGLAFAHLEDLEFVAQSPKL